MIPESVIEEVRARLDAAEVIGRHVPLRKSGASLVGTCPFHAEKSPSFRVYPDQKRFRCYGCGAHGDVFEFIGKLLGKEFPVVVRELAEEVGVQLSDEAGPPHLEMFRKQRAGALAACEASATHWSSRLWGPEGELARGYLAARGVTEATAHQFGLGVASSGWHDLETTVAGHNGLTLADLERAGVVVRKARRRFDRFRDRLMFPCTDSEGRVIGFAARALDAARGPAYLVSPDTILMRRGRGVFGLAQATGAIRRSGTAIALERCFDVLALHRAGIQNTVALLAGELTHEQLQILARQGCREVVLVCVADALPADGLSRLAGSIFHSELTARVASLPSRPGDHVRQRGRADLEAVLAAALPLSDYLIQRAMNDAGAVAGVRASVEQKMAVVRRLAQAVSVMPENLVRSTFERRIAQKLGLDLGALRTELQSLG